MPLYVDFKNIEMKNKTACQDDATSLWCFFLYMNFTWAMGIKHQVESISHFFWCSAVPELCRWCFCLNSCSCELFVGPFELRLHLALQSRPCQKIKLRLNLTCILILHTQVQLETSMWSKHMAQRKDYISVSFSKPCTIQLSASPRDRGCLVGIN